MLDVFNIFKHTAETENSDNSETLGIGFQPISVPHMSASLQLGHENILGLNPSDGPLISAFVDLRWTDPAKDERMEIIMEHLLARFCEALIQTDSYHPWMYPNYAAKFQNAFSRLSNDTLE